MLSQHRALRCGSLWLCLAMSLSGCLFPVIDFDDHSAPQSVAVRARTGGYAHMSPNGVATHARGGLIALPPRQHAYKPSTQRATPQRPARASVLAPDVPAPELPTPADAASCHQML